MTMPRLLVPKGAHRATRADWRDPEQSTLSFRRIREIIPTAKIAAGSDGFAVPLPCDLHDLSPIVVGGDGLKLETYLQMSRANGMLVLRDGVVVYERYLRGFQRRDLHLLWSVSKSIVSTVAGLCGDLVDPARSVVSYIPELEGTAWERALVQHLLDMRVGLDWSESEDGADIDEYDAVYQWNEQQTQQSSLEYIRSLRQGRGSGREFEYQSIATDALAWVLEAASGSRLNELISERLWQPMGASSDAEITLDRYGNPMADGGISATMEDVARFGEAWRRETLVPTEWTESTFTGTEELRQAFRFARRPASRWDSTRYYRNNWWVLDPESRFLAARGFLGQSVHVHGEAGITVVILSSWQDHTPSRESIVDELALRVADTLG
jgi:CubicO group peptidase (beta-lactamase class C family)